MLERPTIAVAAYLAVMVWAFCRAYYFVFYVIEKYIDPGYRFSGLLSFVGYLMGRGKPEVQPRAAEGTDKRRH